MGSDWCDRVAKDRFVESRLSRVVREMTISPELQCPEAGGGAHARPQEEVGGR